MEPAAMQAEGRSGRRIPIFLGLAVLLSWPIWIASGVLPRAGAGPYDFRWLVAQIGVFGPSLAALIVSGASGRELRRNSLRALPFVLGPLVVPGILVALASPPAVAGFPLLPSIASVIVGALVVLFFSPLNRRLLGPATGELQGKPGGGWLVLSVTFMPALFLLAWLLANAGGGAYEIHALRGGAPGSAWILVVCLAHNLLLGGALGEEIGWRGFLLPELLRRMNPMAASIVLGAVWGLWHLPIDLYAAGIVEGPAAILGRVLYAIPMSVLFTWFYLHTKGSLFVALVLHASLNVMGDLGLSRIRATEMAFVVVVAVAALVVSVGDRSLQAWRRRNP